MVGRASRLKHTRAPQVVLPLHQRVQLIQASRKGGMSCTRVEAFRIIMREQGRTPVEGAKRALVASSPPSPTDADGQRRGICLPPLTLVATGSADVMLLLSSARAEMTALPKVDTPTAPHRL